MMVSNLHHAFLVLCFLAARILRQCHSNQRRGYGRFRQDFFQCTAVHFLILRINFLVLCVIYRLH